MHERTPTVGIIVVKDKKDVVLVTHGKGASHFFGSIGAPGGRPELGETLRQAAVRELKEETGLHAEQEDLIELPKRYDADFERTDGSVLYSHHTVFACDNFSGEIRGIDEKDETTPQWVPIIALDDMTLMLNTLEMVKDAQKVLWGK